MPYHRLYFSAIAMRSAELPQVTAYWLMSPWIAAHAASFIGAGIGKSGNPCARLIASYCCATRVISRMTASVKVEVRLAGFISLLVDRLIWVSGVRHCGSARSPRHLTPGPCRSSSPDLRQRRPDQLRRRHSLLSSIERRAHRLLGVGGRVA